MRRSTREGKGKEDGKTDLQPSFGRPAVMRAVDEPRPLKGQVLLEVGEEVELKTERSFGQLLRPAVERRRRRRGNERSAWFLQ
jgi:hypothetical protein